MVPRTELVTIDLHTSYEDIVETIKKERYTRYPIIDGDKDNIVGFLNIKELLTSQFTEGEAHKEFNINTYINPVIQVIETIPIHDLLLKMQKERTHIAILIDEYGGTSGLVTVEDILEEIVGEIRDEFDEDEVPDIRKLNDDHYILDGKLLIEDVNNLLDTNILDDDIDTIGGWFLTRNFNANLCSEVENEGYIFKVQESEDHHIQYIEVTKVRNNVKSLQ